jgi:hypothetical protein
LYNSRLYDTRSVYKRSVYLEILQISTFTTNIMLTVKLLQSLGRRYSELLLVTSSLLDAAVEVCHMCKQLPSRAIMMYGITADSSVLKNCTL